jgi:hypothetical protein
MAEAPEVVPKLLKQPVQCALWKQPELIEGEFKERFEFLKILTDDESPIGNVYRRLLKCRECGQLYLMELYDRGGASYDTFIPVETKEMAECLASRSIYELLTVFPRLQRDHRMDGSDSLRWTIGDTSPRGSSDAPSSFVRRLYGRIIAAFNTRRRR